MTLTSSFRNISNILVKIIGWTSLFVVCLPLVVAFLSGQIGHYYGMTESLLERYANFLIDRPIIMIGIVSAVIWMIAVYIREKQTM